MVYLKLRIVFFIFRTKQKKNSSAKKNVRKAAIKFSESTRFLPVGQARSNKHPLIFGLKFEGMTFWRRNKTKDMHETLIDTENVSSFN